MSDFPPFTNTCSVPWEWRVVICTKGPVGNGSTGPVSVMLMDEGVFDQHTFPDTPWNGTEALEWNVPDSKVNSSTFGSGEINDAKIMLKPGGADFVNISTSFNVKFDNSSDSYATCGEAQGTFTFFDQRDLAITTEGCG